MALSARALAFSVEALVGRPRKRKLKNQKEETQPELLKKEGGEEEERRNSAAGKKREQPGKRPKTEPSATAFSACSGSDSDDHDQNRGNNLGEKGPIQIELQGSELWKRFHDIGTEMIITKAGRRMFPSVRVKVKGLDPGKQYYVAIDMVPVDSKRYRYVYHSSQWMVAVNTDHSCITPRFYVHPDSPCPGETWMRQIISFDRLKLTNNEMDDKGHVNHSAVMHKYKPCVHVMEQDSKGDLSWIQSLPIEGVKTFFFKETEFTTVTAYQNQQITKLKIDRNPFAKGFRDPGRTRGVLDELLETYPWRPSLTLDFKTFGADTQSGSSGSSPVTSGGGTPPLNSLPFLPYSLPKFHLSTSSFGRPCPEVYLHNINLPLCCKICPNNFWRQQHFVLPPPERLASRNSSQCLAPPMMELSTLSSLGFANSKNGPFEDFKGQCLQAPNSSNQMLYVLQSPGNILSPNSIAQEATGCSLHFSYGFYRYNSVPSRLVNVANHLKVNDNSHVSFGEAKCNHDYWCPSINNCL